MSSKKKSSSFQNKLTADQFKLLLQNEIKIYPISVLGTKKWKIQVSIHGKLKTFAKEIMHDDIQEALDKTQLYYWNDLTSKM